MSLAIDPWADAPLEQDQPARPERLKPEDMCEDITARLLRSQAEDRTLYPQLLAKTLTELQRRARGDEWARSLLEQLHHRAVSGVEYGEPREPRFMETLDELERGGH